MRCLLRDEKNWTFLQLMVPIYLQVEEECSGRDQESQSVTTDMNDDSSTSSYTSSNSENKEDENETVTQMKQDTAEKNAAGIIFFDILIQWLFCSVLRTGI